MIITKLYGGLGNQMFQYAAGKRLAHLHKTSLLLDISSFADYKLRRYALDCFSLRTLIATQTELQRVLRPMKTNLGKILKEIEIWTATLKMPIPVVREQYFHFDESILFLGNRVYLEGYWQSEKYFKDVENAIRADFTFREQPDLMNNNMLEIISQTSSVSLHIRRGDFVDNVHTNQKHGICSVEYYKKAISTISTLVSHPHFFIFSDDIDWAKKEMVFISHVTFVEHNISGKHSEDMRLMSMCKHNIIANSSFSWWGAWLNISPNKIVIAPQNWFVDPSRDTKDLLPENWIKI